MSGLDDVKAGDEVILCSWLFRGDDYIERVEKATVRELTVRRVRFRRSDGYQVGGSRYSGCYLLKASDDLIEHCKKIQSEREDSERRREPYIKVRDMDQYAWARLSTDQIVRIASIIDEARK